MRRTTLKQLFQMGYAALSRLGDNCLFLLDRDADMFALFNIGDETVTFLTDTNQDLQDFPTDEELLGDVSIATEKRDLTADKVKVAIRDIMLRPRMIYGENSTVYRKFSTQGMDSLDPDKLHRLAGRVVRIANLYFTQLEPAGLTHAIITNLATLAAQLNTEIEEKDDAVLNRDEATENRIQLGNTLYNKVVILYDIGKTYWADKSEAKYNDYVIYNTPTGAPPTPGATCDAYGIVTDGVTHQPITTALALFEGLPSPVTMDSQGKWAAAGIPLTTLLMRIVAAGYVTKIQAINLVEGGNVEINIELFSGVTPPPPTP